MLEAVFVLFLFWFVWILRSSLFRLYSHCRCVPALRGQSFTEVQDARRTPKNTAVMLIAPGLLGFPAQAWRSVASSWFRHRRVCFFTRRVGVSVPTFSLGARDLSLLPLQLEWTRRLRSLVFGDRQARGVRRPFVRNSPLGVSGARGSR